MKLYRAETGVAINWNKEKKVETLEQLYRVIEQCTSISTESQILMTSLGVIVREENAKQIIEATDRREELVFCYDREYFTTSSEMIEMFIDRETPSLEPEIPFHSAVVLNRIRQTFDKITMEENCHRYIDFFEKLEIYNDTILEAISTHQILAKKSVEEQKYQAIASNVALQNMKSFVVSGVDTVKRFLDDVTKEINTQNNLLQCLDNNVLILKSINIHSPVIDLLPPEFRNRNKLFDFIDIQHIESKKADTIELCEYLTYHAAKLKSGINEVEKSKKNIIQHVAENSHLLALDDAFSDIKKFTDIANACKKGMKPNMNRAFEQLKLFYDEVISDSFNKLSINKNPKVSPEVKKKIERFDHLADYLLNDPVPKLQKYDVIVRKNVANLIKSKRDSVSHFLKQMRSISEVQVKIHQLKVESADNRAHLEDFKEKYGKNDLRSVHHAVVAYGALLIEMVRRKEYKQILIKNSNVIADILSDYRFKEEKRRAYFRHTIRKLLPFQLVDFDNTSPQSEITINGINDQDHIQLDKEDVEEYISILDNAYSQQFNSSLTRQPSFASPRPKKLSSSIKAVESDDIMLLFSTMSNQLNNLKSDFLKTVESSFFTVNQIDPARLQEVIDQQDEPTPPSVTHSNASSTFSVVVDDKKLITATITENNQLKDTLQKMTEDHRKEIEELQLSLKNLENEKEELETQVQNFDSERQAFEQNRQSFINELKNKDKTADFRIASAEEDFQTKISDLQYALEEEKNMRKNLEIELDTINKDHDTEVEELKELLRLEKQKTQDALNEKWEETCRANLLIETVASIKSNLQLEKTQHEESQSERSLYKDRAEKLLLKLEEKNKAVEEIKVYQEHTKLMVARSQQDWIFKDKELKKCKEDQEIVNTAVKELLSRFCDSKDFDLKRDVKTFKESLEEFSDRNYELEQCFKDVKELLNSYKRQDSPTQEINLKTDVKVFKDCLESFIKRYYELNCNFETLTEDFAQLSESHKNLTEVQFEWKTIASHMAEKLEEFRKNVLYELVVKLQLPMDEEELNLLSRNLSPSDDDAAIWNEVLQLSSALNTQRFVITVLENTKNLYDNFVTTKSQLKKMKDKYRHILISNSEKISFRNFKVGDVALFLPTRNSTGKPWAAFNINAPHYFLKSNDTTSSQMQNREWIVARIIEITENTVDENLNPYGLTLGLKYYDLEVENWRTNRPASKSKKRLIEPDSGLASLGSGNTAPPKRPSFSSVSSSSTSIVHSYVNK